MNPNPYYSMFGMTNPYQQMMPQQAQQQNQNILPQQTVIQVDGKASVDALRMSPNSSVLLMDRTAPIIWLCTSDGLGNVSSNAYDIAPHKDAPPVDVASLEQRLAALEERMNDYGKSNARTGKSKQNGRDAREHTENQADV